MTLIRSKQIDKLLQAPIYVAGFVYPAAATASITAALTTAAATAGDGGTSVPVQVASSTAMGFINSGQNRVSVWNSATGAKLSDTAGNEVYGRLTGTYDLALYSAVAGVDTSYVPAAPITVDFEVSYKFTFEKLPVDALTNVEARYVGDDPAASGGNAELLTVTATDVLSAVSVAPNTSKQIKLNVNGQIMSSLVTPAMFTVSGTTVTWSPVNAGYSLQTTDKVVIEYTV